MEKTRYSFLSLLGPLKDLHIVIPNIQRDYVQGRDDKISVRDPFLATIKDALEREEPLYLDLIYGYIRNGNEFIPLDGQQRLTTLFLLHWYLATIDNSFKAFKKILWDGKKNQARFEYRTRPSASAFCRALCRDEVALDTAVQVSEQIENFSFYKDYWNSDPTVKAMLSMLDAISQYFEPASGLFANILAREKTDPLLAFDYLDIKRLDSSDMLYIRMNDRGLPLSHFDKLKASIEKYLGGLDESMKSDFSEKVDGVWTDMVWNSVYSGPDFSVEQFDLAFSHLFFANILTACCLSEESKEHVEQLLDQFLEESKISSSLSFFQYVQMGLFSSPHEEGKRILQRVSNNFDTLCSLREIVKDAPLTPRGLNFDALIREIEYIEGSPTRRYAERILLYGLLQYHLTIAVSDGHDGLFMMWARILQNLVDATAYDRPEDFIQSIQALDRVFQTLPDASAESLLSGSTLKGLKRGFDETQVEEEILKLSLMGHFPAWREIIEDAERTLSYFAGQIEFLLLAAGIDDKESSSVNRSDCGEDVMQAFHQAVNVARSIFGKEGLLADATFMVERVLLTFDGYPNIDGKNLCFLNDSHRDYSWKRFFKRQENSELWEIRKNIFLGLFDRITEYRDLDDPAEFIKKYEDTLDDWKKELILHPDVLTYYEGKTEAGRFMQTDTAHGRVLISKRRLSSSHAEFYSYLFYTIFKESQDFGVFEKFGYFPVSGVPELGEFPCAFFEGWERGSLLYGLNILYKNGTYLVEFFQRKGQQKIEEDVRDAVESCNLPLVEGDLSPERLYFACGGRDEVLATIQDLSLACLRLRDRC